MNVKYNKCFMYTRPRQKIYGCSNFVQTNENALSQPIKVDNS